MRDVFRVRSINHRIVGILQEQLNGAAEKEVDSFWDEGFGNVGRDARKGVYKCRRTIETVAAGKPLYRSDIPRLVVALEEALIEFPLDHDDPAGYGVGTIIMIIQKLQAIQHDSA